jgi:hypothetical protein
MRVATRQTGPSDALGQSMTGRIFERYSNRVCSDIGLSMGVVAALLRLNASAAQLSRAKIFRVAVRYDLGQHSVLG